MKTVAILVTVIAVVTASQKLGTSGTKPSPRIVGGDQAAPHAVPYQAYLDVRRLVRTTRSSKGIVHMRYCSGALISPKFVLTSGRCVEGGSMVQITLGINSPDINNESELISTSVKSIRVHPEYSNVDGIVKNDIALLEPTIDIPIDTPGIWTNIKAVALPSQDDIDNLENFVGYTGRVSGWGLTNGTDETSEANFLEYFDAEIVKNSECKKYFPGEIDSKVLCTEGSATVCKEDDGAPLVVDSKLVGVSSLYVDGCNPGNPSVYTRVTSYIDWIVQETGIVIS